MRTDFQHIWSDKSAGGKHYGGRKFISNRRKAKRDPENAECITSMKKVHVDGWPDRLRGGNGNAFGRYLTKQIGRPWDKIYSEICAVVNNSVRKQVDAYLKYRVAKQIKMIDGLPYEFIGDSFRGSGYLPLKSYSKYDYFYINPDTGLLAKAPPKEDYPQQPTYLAYKHPRSRLIQYHQIEGIWYEVHFRATTLEEKERKSYGHYGRYYDRFTQTTRKVWYPQKDNVFKLSTFDLWYDLYYMTGDYIFPLQKYQLNKKEIKRLKTLEKVF